LELLPGNVRDSLGLLRCCSCRCGSREQLAEDTCSTPAFHEPDGFLKGDGYPFAQKPSLPKVSVLLDVKQLK